MEHVLSDVWKKKDADRKDFTYTPLAKNLKDVVCFPKDNPELLIKIIDNYLDE